VLFLTIIEEGVRGLCRGYGIDWGYF